MRALVGLAFTVLCVVSLAGQAPQPQGRGPSTELRAGGQGARGPVTPEQQEQQRARQLASGPDAARPIDMLDSVWIEELSWMETRDLIRAGKTTAIVGSGGLEQNGPYEPNGKHNYVLRATCEAIARKLGNALCAPIVTLEPGNPEREGITPGSVFITQATFNAILTDMSTSLKTMGFKDIVMIADSGGNVRGMTDTAAALTTKWQGTAARAYYITEYYEEDKWSFDYLKTLGIFQKPDVQSATRWDIHDDYHYQALVALTDPKLIRPEQRRKAGRFSINGVEMESMDKVLANARKLVDYRATITARAIQKAISGGVRP
jgi:creatinine amidohydrolase/Fe(II)-dependent formamide hydrolase-like protein